MLAAGVNIKLVSERLADLLGNGVSKSDDPLESIEVPEQTALMPSV